MGNLVKDAELRFPVVAHRSGPTTVELRFTNGAAGRSAFVGVQGSNLRRVDFAESVNWNGVATKTVIVDLVAGLNTIVLKAPSDWYAPDFDEIRVWQ
ncbi:hypothetical protein [Leifsonia xyli]|uniref:hypothetical protein n=1 Tax=Leifsonia xyli TaxID=1575 RepID=UPI000A602E13|nr:hypothetical protein [Leifsonia xyli]